MRGERSSSQQDSRSASDRGDRAAIRGDDDAAARPLLRGPLDRPLDAVTGLLFITALVLFAAVVAYQVRSILRSHQPRLRAIRALAVGVPLLLVMFAAMYIIVATQRSGAFTEPLSRTDGLYFTVTVFATVGFGDIAPVSELARVLVTVQMLVGLITVGLVAKLVLGAVQVAVARRAQTAEPVGEGSSDQR